MKIVVRVDYSLVASGLLLCVALSQTGCEQPQSKREYLARVGDTYLTQQTLETFADSATLASELFTRDYVSRWVNNELLYQEARRQGMENTEQFKQQLAEARKQFAVEALLRKELYADTADIPEDSIGTYFEQNRRDFILQQDVVKINMAAFSSREKANSFRWKIIGGQPWQSVLQSQLVDTASSIVTHTENRYYTQQTLAPPELWRVAINLLPGEISFSVRSQDAYVVIQSLVRLKRGAQPELDLVRDEIRQRLLIEQRRQQFADLINRLRSHYEIEITAP